MDILSDLAASGDPKSRRLLKEFIEYTINESKEYFDKYPDLNLSINFEYNNIINNDTIDFLI
jgi:hypothetical protein